MLFGKLTHLDGSVYSGYEMQIHTPADHTVEGKQFDVEVTVVFDSVRGDLKTKAAISVLYEKKAGARTNDFFNDLDIMNLPNSITNRKFFMVMIELSKRCVNKMNVFSSKDKWI